MLDWLVETYNEFIDFLYALLLTLFDALKDLFIWIMDTVLLAGELMLEGVGTLLSGLNLSQYFSAIPPELGYFMSAIGVSEGLGMITASLGIRFLLQTIPFVRWGS